MFTMKIYIFFVLNMEVFGLGDVGAHLKAKKKKENRATCTKGETVREGGGGSFEKGGGGRETAEINPDMCPFPLFFFFRFFSKMASSKDGEGGEMGKKRLKSDVSFPLPTTQNAPILRRNCATL